MKKYIEYTIDKSEIEEYASKLAGKKLVMVEPVDFESFFFEEREAKR